MKLERDGWRFVLLVRFSPLPSCVVNYAMAATEVSFLVDFLLPTVIGCLPMILQNIFIGSLAGAALASASSDSKKSQISSYLFPLLGSLCSVFISLRIKRYTYGFAVAEDGKGSSPSKKAEIKSNDVPTSTDGTFS